MNRILATAGTEFRIALRNRWVAIAVALMALFSLVLSAAGSAPSGGLGVDRLSVTVASLTSLSVYLVPLLANPADAFRLYNLSASQATAAAAGVGGAANAIPLWQSLSSVLLWPLAALGLATAAFGKVTP